MPPSEGSLLYGLSVKEAANLCLFRHTDRRGSCRIWNRGLGGGYAHVRYQKKDVILGRLILEAFSGMSMEEASSKGLVMCHARECTSRACIAPWHLRWDTQEANHTDRSAVGDTANTKLSPEQVREIRRLKGEGWSHESVAEMFGLSFQGVGKIMNGKTYKWVA